MIGDLAYHDKLLDAVNKAASLLLTTKEETFDADILNGMEMLGNDIGFDRIAVMKNIPLDEKLDFYYQYEWISDKGMGVSAIGKGTPFAYTFSGEWLDKFSKNRCVNGPLCSFPPEMREIFSRLKNIKSILIIPMFTEDKFWGLVSFSDFKEERTFTDDEVNILRSASLMMVSAINRSEQSAEISEINNRTKLLLDSMPFTCHLWNKNFEMFECNEENARLFKIKDKQEVADNFDSFSPEYQPDGRPSQEVAREYLQKAFDEGRFVGEFLHQASDGEPLPVEITLVRVKYGGEDVVAAYARDLREHKKMMGEIIELKERLWEKVEVGMIIIDIGTRTILDVNPAVCSMFGGGREEIIGEKCHKFFGQHDCPIIDGGMAMDREERKFIKSDGSVIPIQKSIAKIQYNGRPAFLESFSDISYLKAAEEQKRMLEVAEQANSAKSEFLANISHEMRTPLNAVLGLSGLTLEMEDLSENAAVNLEKIYSSGSTLLNIVNDILDISKIEAGKLELFQNEYDIPSMINDVVTQNILRIGSKLIDFQLDISEDIPAMLYGDDMRIKQILSNLLSNAFKYTKEGTVELGMRSEYIEGGGEVILTAWVRDTGIGIRNEDIKKLFSDYAQVDTKANRRIEGTGLGLSITRKMIELMGGTISVESEYGKGSVFTIRIKQKFVTDTPIGKNVVENLKHFKYSNAKRKQNSRIARIKMPYARVLVVDDNLTNLDVAKGLMKPYGMQVDCVSGGQEAIDAVASQPGKYSAVFMDHMMPGMDGVEAARRIREIDTDYARKIPIIALTANAIAFNDEKFVQKGFQDFLSKPIDLLRLDEVLRRWIRDKGKEHEEQERHEQPGAIKIPGINTEKALGRFGGDRGILLNVLRSYAVNNRPVLEQLKAVKEETLDDYVIAVHGIKGASYGIFAEEAGTLAEELEKAAKARDFGLVEEKTPGFIERAEKLISEIEKELSAVSAENHKQKKDKPDTEVVKKLISACEEYDVDNVNRLMEEICEYEYDSSGSLVDWLKDNITEGNFDEIAEKLSALAA